MDNAIICKKGFILQVGSDVIRGNLCMNVEKNQQFIVGLNPLGFPSAANTITPDGLLFADGLISGLAYRTFKPLFVTTDTFETTCRLNGMQPG